MVHQMLLGRPPRPRDASVCPLDIGGLIGVRRETRAGSRVTFRTPLIFLSSVATPRTTTGSVSCFLRVCVNAVDGSYRDSSNTPFLFGLRYGTSHSPEVTRYR